MCVCVCVCVSDKRRVRRRREGGCGGGGGGGVRAVSRTWWLTFIINVGSHVCRSPFVTTSHAAVNTMTTKHHITFCWAACELRLRKTRRASSASPVSPAPAAASMAVTRRGGVLYQNDGDGTFTGRDHVTSTAGGGHEQQHL